MTNQSNKNYFIGFLFVYLCGYKSIIVMGEIFTLGYLTGSQRRAGNLEYAKPGWWDFSIGYFVATPLFSISGILAKATAEC